MLEGAVGEAVGREDAVVEATPGVVPRGALGAGLLTAAETRVDFARVSEEVPLTCAIEASLAPLGWRVLEQVSIVELVHVTCQQLLLRPAAIDRPGCQLSVQAVKSEPCSLSGTRFALESRAKGLDCVSLACLSRGKQSRVAVQWTLWVLSQQP